MRQKLNVLVCALPLLWVAPGLVGQTQDSRFERFWISREFVTSGVDNCKAGSCPQVSDYTTRLFAPRNDAQMRRMMALLDFQAAANGQPLEHPDAPEFCAKHVPDDVVVWNPEWMQMSNKLEALRGLEGLYVDVSGLKGPSSYEGNFGNDLQSELQNRFAQAGVRIVTQEEVELIPGKPKLAVYFSQTNPDTGCWWSVFATMTQTAILTRDINVKLNVGSWAFMKGYDPDNLNLTEYDAIVEVFEKFTQDFREANDQGFVPVNVPPYVDLLGNPMTAPDVHVKSYADIVKEALVAEAVAPIESAEDVEVTEVFDNPSDGFTPAAAVPEIGPKSDARARARGDGAESIAQGAVEKLTSAGEAGG